MMDIKLDNINFQEVFTAAIVQSLDENKKQELLKGAVASLFQKSEYSKKTKLQEAFESAMQQKAIEYIKDFIDTDPQVKESIFGLIRDAVVKINSEARDKTVGKIAEKIIEGLYSEKY